MAHTQGPWHITDGDTDGDGLLYEAFGIYADHTALTEGVPASLIGWVAANGWDEDIDNAIILDEDRANATLIAGAPALLAALRAAAEAFAYTKPSALPSDAGVDWEAVAEQVDLAIYKATNIGPQEVN
jgi:hypothetical protein